MTTDWRLKGTESEWLTGGRYRHADYRAWSYTWDRDPCELCWREIAERPIIEHSAGSSDRELAALGSGGSSPRL